MMTEIVSMSSETRLVSGPFGNELLGKLNSEKQRREETEEDRWWSGVSFQYLET